MPQRLLVLRVSGISEEARRDLLSRLPIREGETLTSESLENATRIVKKFDQHLEVNVGHQDDGVVLRIHTGHPDVFIFKGRE